MVRISEWSNVSPVYSKALDELGLKRYCCRRMFISNVELIDEIIQFGRK